MQLANGILMLNFTPLVLLNFYHTVKGKENFTAGIQIMDWSMVWIDVKFFTSFLFRKSKLCKNALEAI